MLLLPRPGTYALILAATAAQSLTIGHLGTLNLQPGYYIYAGSAFGPGGVKARAGRHVRLEAGQKPHWHVDYLRPAVELKAVWHTYDPVPREHQWAALLQQCVAPTVPLPRFGASDCRCPAHLFYTPRAPAFEAFQRCLSEHVPDHAACFLTTRQSLLYSGA